MRRLFRIFLMTIFFCSLGLVGLEAVADDSAAIQQTQAVLRDKTQTNAILQKSANGQNNGQKVANDIKAVGAPNDQDIYNAAAEIFPDLYKQGQGDPEKMQKILDQATRDPAAFMKSLSEANQKRISDIAKSAEAAKQTAPQK